MSFRPEPCGFVCSPIVAYPANDGAYSQYLPAGSYYNAASCDLDLTIDPDMNFECWAVGHVGTGPYTIWVTSATSVQIDYVICPADLWDDPACVDFRPPS